MISIHAPRVGRDDGCTARVDVHAQFQSTRPVWGATIFIRASRTPADISIHAPRVGRDSPVELVIGLTEAISIHAPRVGRDDLLCQSSGALSYFNPRAPCGARLVGRKKMHKKWDNFNPRAPCGARRVILARTACRLNEISIHAPRVGRDRRALCPMVMQCDFNPRAPCGARLISRSTARRTCTFQSTRPVWGATSLRGMVSPPKNNFNPRAPCGARRRPAETYLAYRSFQSTRPVWGATREL